MTTNSGSHKEKDLPHVPAQYLDLIQDEIQKILACPEFTATEQQRKFLTYVVNETLVSRADSIKGYTVATQVFGRAENFDDSLDPIVSIQANKLRRARASTRLSLPLVTSMLNAMGSTSFSLNLW